MPEERKKNVKEKVLGAGRRLRETEGEMRGERVESGEGADCHGQRAEEDKEAGSSSIAIQAGIGGF